MIYGPAVSGRKIGYRWTACTDESSGESPRFQLQIINVLVAAEPDGKAASVKPEAFLHRLTQHHDSPPLAPPITELNPSTSR